MNRTIKLIVAGLILLFGSVWGGAFMVHYAPQWLEFATLATALILFLLGGALLGLACGDTK